MMEKLPVPVVAYSAPRASFDEEIAALAGRIVANSPFSHRANKRLPEATGGGPLDAGLQWEVMENEGVGPDMHDRIAAFTTKQGRSPANRMNTGQRQLAVRAIVAIYREFEQIARRSDISMAQYRLLLYLLNGPRRAGAIAAAAELAKPTVSLAIGGLRDKGWLESGGDADGRASVVVITHAGRERIERFERHLADAMKTMVGDDVDGLGALMADIYVAMDATKEQRLKSVERDLSG